MFSFLVVGFVLALTIPPSNPDKNDDSFVNDEEMDVEEGDAEMVEAEGDSAMVEAEGSS